MTGGYFDEEVTTVTYWLRHMMQPVLCQSAVEVMLWMGTESAAERSGAWWRCIECTVVEMGADSTLTKMGRAVPRAWPAAAV